MAVDTSPQIEARYRELERNFPHWEKIKDSIDQFIDVFENYRQTGRFQHQLLLAAARERGITMTSEGGPLYFDVGVVMDGQTGWEHLIANLPIYRDAARFFGQARAVYSPTAIVAGHVLGSMHWRMVSPGL